MPVNAVTRRELHHSRGHDPSIAAMFFAAALTSLNTINLAVFADKTPFVRTVR
jgi:hypothetical protein